jgi:hypothetical protein
VLLRTLQILISGVIVLASLLCARFGHSACLSRGCPGEQSTLRGDAEVGVVAHYWTNVFPAVVLTAEKSLGAPAILMLSSVDAVPRRDHCRVQQRCSDAAGHAAQ